MNGGESLSDLCTMSFLAPDCSHTETVVAEVSEAPSEAITLMVWCLINPFPPNDTIWRHETFSFMMSHLAMSLEDRFCDSRKGGTGEVGGCTRRVPAAWPCLGSTVERSWSALGGPFLPFLA